MVWAKNKEKEIAVMRLLSLFLFLMITISSSGQEHYSALFLNALFEEGGYLDDYKVLTGRIDDFIPMAISLGRKGDEVCGMISFLDDEDDYILRGIQTEDGEFRLNEYFEDEMFTGSVKLNLGADTWTGEWQSRDKNVVVQMEGFYLGRPHGEASFPGDIVFFESPDTDLMGYEAEGNPMPKTLVVDEDFFELYQAGGRSVASDIKGGYKYHANLIPTDRGVKVSFDKREAQLNRVSATLPVETIYHYDFFQSVVVLYPYLPNEHFTKYVADITKEWMDELLVFSTLNIEKEPSTRWIHSHQIWFETHYYDGNLLSGVFHKKSSIPGSSEAVAVIYDLNKGVQISLDQYLKNTDELKSELSFEANREDIDLDKVSICSAGFLYNLPFEVVRGYQKYLVGFDLVPATLKNRRLPKKIQRRLKRRR